MARKRMIDPDFWSDEKFGMLSSLAQLLFIGMWNFADDEGLIKYSSAYLRSSIFPYKDIPLEEINEARKEIEETKNIFKYRIENNEYCWIINFRKHQVINKPQPSKLPHPSIQNNEYKNAIFRRDRFICHICGQQTDYIEHKEGTGSAFPSVDHLKPQSKGGNDYPSNLKCCCLSCNKSKNNKTITELLPEDYGNDTTMLPPKRIEEKIKEEKGKEVEDNAREETTAATAGKLQIKSIQTILENSGILHPSTTEVLEIDHWLKEQAWGIEILEEAAKEMALNNKHQSSYIITIFKRWSDSGFKTLGAIKADQQAFEQRKQRPKQKSPPLENSKKNPDKYKLIHWG